MEHGNRHPHRELTPTEAEAWFARLHAPDCDDDTRRRFRHWFALPGHAEAWAAVQRRWALAGSPAVRAGLGQALSAALVPARRRRPALAWAAAVLLLATAGLVGWMLVDTPVVERLHAAETALRTTTLADGSRLVLAAGAEVETRYTRRQREVRVLRGEVLLDVVPAGRRGFVARAGGSMVRVHGTRFLLGRDAHGTRVTLLRGRVTVSDAALPEALPLQPGERLVIGDDGRMTRDQVEIDVASAWTRGRLVFRATPLAEAVADINRYVTPRLRIADTTLAGLPVSGSIHTGNSDAVAAALAELLPLRVERTGGELVLHARPAPLDPP